MAISGLSLPNLFAPRATQAQTPVPAAVGQQGSEGGQSQESYQASAPESGSGSSAASLLGGFLDSYGPKLNLDEDQLKQIRSAAPHLERAAGADGKWGPDDLADNVQAFKNGKFSPLAGVVERSLRQGFEEMTGKPVPALTQEQKDAALERWNNMSADEKRNARLTAPQLKSIGTALNAVKDSTPLTALGGKSESIPGDFLSKVADKPTLGGLLEAKKGSSEEAAPPPEASTGESRPEEPVAAESPAEETLKEEAAPVEDQAAVEEEAPAAEEPPVEEEPPPPAAE